MPYRGGGPALNDVMGGQVPLLFANVASSLGHIQSGRVRTLGGEVFSGDATAFLKSQQALSAQVVRERGISRE